MKIHTRLFYLILALACGPATGQLVLPGDGADIEPKIGMDLRDLIPLTNPGRTDTLYPVSVNNWWGYMNQRGHLVVFPQFDWTDDFYDGLARAVIEGKTGFVKGNGGWVHKPIYPYADRYAEGRAIVGDGEHFGFIEKSGKLMVPIRLDGVLRFQDGLAAVMKDGLCGFINRAGDVDIPLRFTSVRSFHQGFAAVTLPGKGGAHDQVAYIDRRGKVVFSDPSGSVAELGDFNDGLARVRGGEKWGYLGRSWKLRIDARFDDARDFTNGIAAVRIGDKWGFIDKTGKLVIQPTYDNADDFDDKLIMVTLEGKVGYTNRVANYGITPQFDGGRPFFNNYARVGTHPSFGYITLAEKLIWDPRLALKGFINKRSTESAAITQIQNITHHRTVDPPLYREPIPDPYPPDHLYDEVLPPSKK